MKTLTTLLAIAMLIAAPCAFATEPADAAKAAEAAAKAAEAAAKAAEAAAEAAEAAAEAAEAAAEAAGVEAAETQTLEGEYIWKRQDGEVTGPLKAVFEATGDATWNVSFYFTFEEEDHTYVGTAEGSLTDGDLAGSVMTDGEEPRPFTFKGSFVDGKFTGTHGGERDGELFETGTLTLGH